MASYTTTLKTQFFLLLMIYRFRGRGCFCRFAPFTVAFLLAILAPQAEAAEVPAAKLRFAISFPEAATKAPLDGRLLLLISTNDAKEPRFQINEDLDTQQVFGMDVDGLKPGQAVVLDSTSFGYPLKNLAQVPTDEYWVQALLHRYETFHRADGHTPKLPMDRGEGQHWNSAPGNLYSKPQKLATNVRSNQTITLTLDQVVPPIEPPKDTKYVKHIRIQSKLLSDFWGRPIELGAHVLLPEGFEAHPQARYPLAIYHSHFAADFTGFREAPPDPNLKPEYSPRFKLDG